MKLRSFMLLLICAAFIGLMFAVSFYSLYLVYDIKSLPMDVKVSDHYALNLDTDAVHFGKITTPGGGDRSVLISNTHNKPLSVTISPSGKMADWLTANETRFIIEPGTSRRVMLSLDVPAEITFGNYTGTIKIQFMRVLI